jgi:hypothetical protein
MGQVVPYRTAHLYKIRGKQTDFADYPPVVNQSLAVKPGRRVGCGPACVSSRTGR